MAGRALRRRFRPEKSFTAKASPWIIGLFVVANLGIEIRARRYDSEISAAIQDASGRPELDVRCRRWWDYLGDFRPNEGFVYWGSTTANLSWAVCSGASRWPDDSFSEDTQMGLMILSHELAHLAGHRNEAETDCVAMWAAPRVGEALGGTRTNGQATARWYAANASRLVRADYLSPGCLSGAAPASSLLD